MAKGRIVLPFADGVYAFRFLGAQLREHQELTKAGPFVVYGRLLSREWTWADVRETIRLGLIGGAEGWVGAVLNDSGEPEGGEHVAVSPTKAVALVARYVDTYAASTPGLEGIDPDEVNPAGRALAWAESAVLAAQVLSAGIQGVEGEPLGKKEPGEKAEGPTLSPTAESAGPQSSPPSPNEA